MKKHFTPKQKAVVALEALKEVKTMAQIASEYEVHPVAVGTWKKQLRDHAPTIFSQKQERDSQQQTIDELHRIIGQREAELTWLKKKLAPFHTP